MSLRPKTLNKNIYGKQHKIIVATRAENCPASRSFERAGGGQNPSTSRGELSVKRGRPRTHAARSYRIKAFIQRLFYGYSTRTFGHLRTSIGYSTASADTRTCIKTSLNRIYTYTRGHSDIFSDSIGYSLVLKLSRTNGCFADGLSGRYSTDKITFKIGYTRHRTERIIDYLTASADIREFADSWTDKTL